MLADLPAFAAFRHAEVRDGFETVFFRDSPASGFLIDGATSAVEDGTPWSLGRRCKD